MSAEELYAPVTVAPTAIVGDGCVLGFPREARLRNYQSLSQAEPGDVVTVGERTILMNHVVLYEGVRLGDDCLVDDRVRVGYGTSVGPRSRLVYGAYICDRVTIGADARVAGFVCDGTTIGDRSTVMGDLTHEYTRPHQDWWEVDEEPPVVEPDTVVGYGAVVVGGVRIGPRSYVAAGAIVTKDVPPHHVVTGCNVQTPAEAWSGRRLQQLIRHWLSPPTASPVDER